MERFYVGLDLGSSAFQQVAISADGAIKVNRSFSTSETNLRAAFADQHGEIHVHLEAGELAPWAAAVIAPLVTRVVCSHPKDNAWIAKDADKCDRIDAFKLAELYFLSSAVPITVGESKEPPPQMPYSFIPLSRL